MAVENNLSSSDFIIEHLNEIFKDFDGIKIRYEFRSYISTHLIEILPLELFEDVAYVLTEIEIQNKFEELYGSKEDILFISSDSLNEIRNASFCLGY